MIKNIRFKHIVLHYNFESEKNVETGDLNLPALNYMFKTG